MFFFKSHLNHQLNTQKLPTKLDSFGGNVGKYILYHGHMGVDMALYPP